MSNIEEVKRHICEVGKLLYNRGYVVTNDGNISVRIAKDEVIITPSGVNKARMTPEMLVRVNLDGAVLEGSRHPSSEAKMHLAVYQYCPDIHAVVHAHPPCGTSFAICHKPIDKRYSPEMLLNIGTVPVAEFALPSTDAVPQSIQPFLQNHKAVLLANHGVLTWGSTLWDAFDRMEVVETAAKICMNVDRIGGAVELSEEDAQTLFGLLDNYKRLAQERE